MGFLGGIDSVLYCLHNLLALLALNNLLQQQAFLWLVSFFFITFPFSSLGLIRGIYNGVAALEYSGKSMINITMLHYKPRAVPFYFAVFSSLLY